MSAGGTGEEKKKEVEMAPVGAEVEAGNVSQLLNKPGDAETGANGSGSPRRLI